MNGISPTVLKLAASAAFGLAATLLGVVVYQLMRSETGARISRDVSQRRAEQRRLAIAGSTGYAAFLAVLRLFAGFVARLEMESLRRYVREPYSKAGYPGGMDDDELITLGVAISVFFGGMVSFMLMVFFGIGWALLGLALSPAGFMGMIASLQNRAERRQKRILLAMPYVLDLLVLVLRSGTSLNIALARVVNDYAGHPVGEELGQLQSEIEMGAPRAEAFKRLATRLDQADITALCESMIQSEELGWPLADTLARQADRMAAERILSAQATAGAAGVWVMLPSTLVLVGAVLLLFGPMIVRYLQGGFALK